jgi:transposase
MLIKGAMNGEAFLAYIEQCLAPTLKRGDIVVADNVSFHKIAGVEEALRRVGASLRFLPQYSPDLNPIELAFHPAKTCLRKAASAQSKDCTDVSDRSFGRSILLNAGGILVMQAMIHHDWDTL